MDRLRRTGFLIGVLGALLACSPVSAAVPGTLDRAFGGDGRVVLDEIGFKPAVAIDSRNRVVIAGEYEEWGHGGYRRFQVVRLLPSGEYDPTFGGDGVRRFKVGKADSHVFIHTVAIQPDGKILLGGSEGTVKDDSGEFALVRLMPNGRLDSSFGTNGTLIESWPKHWQSGTGWIQDLVLRPDGKIVVAGQFGRQGWIVARFRSNGKRDRTFGRDGMSEVPGTGGSEPAALVLWRGRIVVGGFLGWQQFAVARLLADGRVDRSFGNGGLKATPIEDTGWGIEDIAVRPNGKIVAVGTANYSAVVVRYTQQGREDPTFDGDGIKFMKFPSGDGFSRADSVLLQPSGAILVAGGTEETLDDFWDYDFALARLRPTGALDESFGPGGVVATNVGDRHDVAHEMAFDRSGRLVVVGEVDRDEADPHHRNHLGVARYLMH